MLEKNLTALSNRYSLGTLHCLAVKRCLTTRGLVTQWNSAARRERGRATTRSGHLWHSESTHPIGKPCPVCCCLAQMGSAAPKRPSAL